MELWYREPAEDADPGVYRMLDEELPCTVTLYDGAGEVLKTVSLTVTSGAGGELEPVFTTVRRRLSGSFAFTLR